MNINDLIARINELAKKAKTTGLTESELVERDKLRRQYIDLVKQNLAITLENTVFVDENGNEIKFKSNKTVH
ncbi:MAG: DUF896 domain-containing protein [Firmicutes bacterium]|nr:DUF896 domain-containing protein [Bacillota bacterium]